MLQDEPASDELALCSRMATQSAVAERRRRSIPSTFHTERAINRPSIFGC